MTLEFVIRNYNMIFINGIPFTPEKFRLKIDARDKSCVFTFLHALLSVQTNHGGH